MTTAELIRHLQLWDPNGTLQVLKDDAEWGPGAILQVSGCYQLNGKPTELKTLGERCILLS